MFFQFAPTFYFSDRGRFAGRIVGSYDLLITNRLIAQPEFEMNFYSKRDPSRGIRLRVFRPRYRFANPLRGHPQIRAIHRIRLYRYVP
jgi:uncharacterized protein involved in copper resistance